MPDEKGSRSSSPYSDPEGYNSSSSDISFILVSRKAKKLVKTTAIPKTNGTDSSKHAKNVTGPEQRASSPVPSTSTQHLCERVFTFMDDKEEKPWMQLTNVDRCSSSKIANDGLAEQRERNQGASKSTQFQPEVASILENEIHDVEMKNVDVAQSSPQRKSVILATFVAAKQPHVRRSKRIRDSSNVWTSQVPKQLPPSRKVPVPKQHEKFFEGAWLRPRFMCQVIHYGQE